ncbi:hypothetical protein DWV57_03255 [Faecalibacterium sp. AF10-46]|nr:hypothetical protein DWV57_03255 [Faecalibacterium sp. AF10-46]
MAAVCGNGLALSVTFGDSSPKGGALGKTGNFAVLPRPLPLGKVDANAVSRRRGRGCLPRGSGSRT